MAAPDPSLSKSRFLRGTQCALSLYFAVFEPARLEPPDADSQARMATGLEIGRLAQRLFPGGIQAGSADAAELLAAGPPAIFELTLSAGGCSARIDILARGRRGWRLIEVKSSTSVKPEHVPDVAFQLWLARQQPIAVERVDVLHLNGDYLRRGELDLEGLFTAEDVTAEAERLAPAVALAAGEHLEMLRQGRRPQVAIGPHCLNPHDCDCLATCWATVPPGSVLEIARLAWKKRFALYHSGLVRIDDVPSETSLPAQARRHVAAHKSHRPLIDRQGLRAFLATLVDPVYLLDFETVGLAVPRWDGSRPYDRIPFQYSLHILRQPGAAPEHRAFLAEPGPDPRPALLDSLFAETAGAGTILAYHMPFERDVLKRMAEVFPDRRAEIEARLPRMNDLIKPFRAWHYWRPEMGGSFSIKSVAPALAPDLSYDGLEIGDGMAASRAYEALLGGLDPPAAERLRQALLVYCGLDTLAMVRVLEAIRQAAESQ
jgi:hypothetical protein